MLIPEIYYELWWIGKGRDSYLKKMIGKDQELLNGVKFGIKAFSPTFNMVSDREVNNLLVYLPRQNNERQTIVFDVLKDRDDAVCSRIRPRLQSIQPLVYLQLV